MTKGSTITETLQVSDTMYSQYVVLQDTMNNPVMLQCINFRIGQHFVEFICQNKQWQFSLTVQIHQLATAKMITMVKSPFIYRTESHSTNAASKGDMCLSGTP